MYSRNSSADLVRELYTTPLREDEAAFIYLGYSGIVVRTASEAVAFDLADLLKSREIETVKRLDLLLFTHSHGDHYKSIEAIEIFKATGAHIVAEPLVAEDLKGKIPSDKLISAVPEKTYTIGDFEVSTVKGIHGGPINLYRVEKGEISMFHAGDSGYVPLKGYKTDLAFLPTGSPSPTASPVRAFRMALELEPKAVVSIHGSPSQNEEFQKKITNELPETELIVPEPYSLRKLSLKKK